MRRTLIGTSGWSYDDWVGPFYPKALSPGDRLHYYAEHFSMVEVNETHQRMPTPEEMADLTKRVQRTSLTDVVVKVPRSVTHEAVPAGLAAEARAELDRFFSAIEPLARSDLLTGVVLQFDHGTGPEEVLAGVEAAIAMSPPAPLFAEVRHALFNEDRYLAQLRKLVEDNGGCVVASDSPASTITRAPPASTAYFRFHGRNRDAWFVPDPTGEHAPARYDHLYTHDELEELAIRVRSAEAQRVLVTFNNRTGGKAAANAQALMRLLGVQAPGKARTLDDFS